MNKKLSKILLITAISSFVFFFGYQKAEAASVSVSASPSRVPNGGEVTVSMSSSGGILSWRIIRMSGSSCTTRLYWGCNPTTISSGNGSPPNSYIDTLPNYSRNQNVYYKLYARTMSYAWINDVSNVITTYLYENTVTKSPDTYTMAGDLLYEIETKKCENGVCSAESGLSVDLYGAKSGLTCSSVGVFETLTSDSNGIARYYAPNSTRTGYFVWYIDDGPNESKTFYSGSTKLANLKSLITSIDSGESVSIDYQAQNMFGSSDCSVFIPQVLSDNWEVYYNDENSVKQVLASGASSRGGSVNFNEDTPGTYTISLKNHQNNGDTFTDSIDITVNSLNQAPIIDSFTCDSPVEEGSNSTCTITASDPDGDTLTYAITIAQGTNIINTYNTRTATHTFNSAGTYTAQAVVSDGELSSTMVLRSIIVNEIVQEATNMTLSGNDTVIQGNDINLTATLTDNNGNALAFKDITHRRSGSTIIATAGTGSGGQARITYYTTNDNIGDRVTVTVNFAGDKYYLSSSANKTITVVEPPPGFSVSLSASPVLGDSPLTVDLVARASNFSQNTIAFYFYCDYKGSDSGYDKIKSKWFTNPEASYTCAYNNSGTYEARVRATQADGNEASASQTITVNEPEAPTPLPTTDTTPPSATIVSTSYAIDKGGSVTISGTATDCESGLKSYDITQTGGSITSGPIEYNAEVSGCSGKGFTLVARFDTIGSFKFRIRAQDNEGNISGLIETPEIVVSEPTIIPPSPPTPEPEPEPEPVYQPRIDVSLLASPDSGDEPLEVAFVADGYAENGIEKWELCFGYSQGCVTKRTTLPHNITHTYETDGGYTATLTIWDNNGDTGQYSYVIAVHDYIPPASEAYQTYLKAEVKGESSRQTEARTGQTRTLDIYKGETVVFSGYPTRNNIKVYGGICKGGYQGQLGDNLGLQNTNSSSFCFNGNNRCPEGFPDEILGTGWSCWLKKERFTGLYNNQTKEEIFNSAGQFTKEVYIQDSGNRLAESKIIINVQEPNRAPNIPSGPGLADGAINVPVNTNLTWSGGDIDGDLVSYDVYVNGDNLVYTVNNSVTNKQIGGPLQYSAEYNWQIIAHDDEFTTSGPVWTFTTEPPPNQAPNTPSNPGLPDGAINVPVDTNLTWSGGDPDGDETVSYKVLLDGNEIVSSTSDTIVENEVFGHLEYGTAYGWQVIANDGESTTSGPVWGFTTINCIADIYDGKCGDEGCLGTQQRHIVTWTPDGCRVNEDSCIVADACLEPYPCPECKVDNAGNPILQPSRDVRCNPCVWFKEIAP